MSTLKIEHVGQRLGDTEILHDVNLEVRDGEICCLLGPSGCGKTTLFNIIAGLSLPTEGSVFVAQKDVTGVTGQVAYMLQKDLLLKEKTILDNVALPLMVRGVAKKQARAQALELFDRFGLAGTQDKWPHELSGGMRQRAALLRSYLFSQEFLLLDEPFSALDAFTKSSMHEWFLEIATELGTTALMVTHDVDEAIKLSDTVFVMAGSPQEGVATTIIGAHAIDVPKQRRSDFVLTPEFLDHKRAVLELLHKR